MTRKERLRAILLEYGWVDNHSDYEVGGALLEGIYNDVRQLFEEEKQVECGCSGCVESRK